MTDLAVEPVLPPASVPPSPGRRPVVVWAALGLVAVLLAVALGGAAPGAVPDGLPDPGPLPGWSLPLARLAGHGALLLVVAVLLAALLGASTARRRLVAVAALLWALTGVGTWLLLTAEVVGLPLADLAAQPDLLRYTALELPQGRAALQSAALAVAVALLAPLARRRAGAALVLLLALLAAVPSLLVGHAAAEGDHRTAQALLVAHVVAAVLWTGGLAGLALVPGGPALATAAARFSPLALGCAVVVGATGAASGLLRLDHLADLATGYGVLLLLKSAVLVLLVVAGARHRQRTLPALHDARPGAFRRLATVEVGAMAVAFGLAAALARTPPA